MPHVTGIATITIEPNGRRIVITRDLQVNPNPKPLTLAESGSDPAVWARIRAGKVGTHAPVAHFGGATALFAPTRSIALPSPRLLWEIARPFGGCGAQAMIGAIRTSNAPGTQGCADTTGAMHLSLDWKREALEAMCKILVFKVDGWVRILLPAYFAQYQDALDLAQRKRWSVARPGFERKHEVRINFPATGRDTFNSESTLVVFGPIGDVQYVRAARLELESDGYRFCDGEWRTGKIEAGEGELVPLKRKIVAIVPAHTRPGRPLILSVHPNGYLHPEAGPQLLDTTAEWAQALSHNPLRVLGPHGLGWLK